VLNLLQAVDGQLRAGIAIRQIPPPVGQSLGVLGVAAQHDDAQPRPVGGGAEVGRGAGPMPRRHRQRRDVQLGQRAPDPSGRREAGRRPERETHQARRSDAEGQTTENTRRVPDTEDNRRGAGQSSQP
jgi:hypothetical protein